MELKHQRRLAASILKSSGKRIKFDPARLEEIKESITKADVSGLIRDKAIKKVQKRGVSKHRAKKAKVQKRKGRGKGYGNRQGAKYARLPRKERWMNAVRAQRTLLKELKEKKEIDAKLYKELYLKVKCGCFRSKRHIQLYLKERK